MRTQQMLGSATVVGVLVIFFLIAVGIARHSASVQGTGSVLLWVDVALLLTYGIAGIWVWHQSRPEVNTSVSVGAQVGRATLAVAKKLVAYLMAVDRGQRNFQVVETNNCIAA